MASRELSTAAFDEGLEDAVAATLLICFGDGIQRRLVHRVYYFLRLRVSPSMLVFAVTMISRWATHILEQYVHNRLIRWLAEYSRPIHLFYKGIEKRS